MKKTRNMWQMFSLFGERLHSTQFSHFTVTGGVGAICRAEAVIPQALSGRTFTSRQKLARAYDISYIISQAP